MKPLTLLPAALKLALLSLFGLFLAACTIQSKDALIPTSEFVNPLPATVAFFSYDEDKTTPGAYVRSKDAPLTMAMDPVKGYVASDNSIAVHFAKTDDPEYFVVDVAGDGQGGHIYGIARYHENLLGLWLILKDADPSIALDAAKAAGGADALKDATVADGAITVTSRAALDYIVGMIRGGKLQMSPFVAYIADNINATAPGKIVADGDFFKAE